MMTIDELRRGSPCAKCGASGFVGDTCVCAWIAETRFERMARRCRVALSVWNVGLTCLFIVLAGLVYYIGVPTPWGSSADCWSPFRCLRWSAQAKQFGPRDFALGRDYRPFPAPAVARSPPGL